MAQAADRGFPQGSQLLSDERTPYLSYFFCILLYHTTICTIVSCLAGVACTEALGIIAATKNICHDASSHPHDVTSAEHQNNRRLASSHVQRYVAGQA